MVIGRSHEDSAYVIIAGRKEPNDSLNPVLSFLTSTTGFIVEGCAAATLAALLLYRLKGKPNNQSTWARLFCCKPSDDVTVAQASQHTAAV